VETRDIRHVFMMTGAIPNTRWLDGCIALDDKGFVKTGSDLSADDLIEIDDATTVQGRHAIFGESTNEARQR